MRVAFALAVGGSLGLFLATAPAAGPEERPPVSPQAAEFFERRVRPVLVENCVSCHGPKMQKGGLRLDSSSGLLKGGDSGPIVTPGKPDDSPMIEAVRRIGAVKMPPKKPLGPDAVADLSTWVKMGLPWPEPAMAKTGAGTEAPTQHWAFQPIRDPAFPQVKDNGWLRTSVDAFVLARLEAKELAPSPAADRRTLIRRATFDLTGLPPTPEEVAAFEADTAPDAFARLVDRLLASPHYGERWGRYWLDVARYADTKGYVFFQDANFDWPWTYRDYVVRSFNDDLPFDRFVVEQIAADRLPLGHDRRALTALGFLTLGGRFMNNAHDIIDDRIDVVTRGLMGLTVSCARCHDHKFDPIPTADYYALYGVFGSSVEPTVPPLYSDPPRSTRYDDFARELRKREEYLAEFVRSKHAELVRSARTRVAEYLLAAHARRDQPDTEDFMLIADGGDLNPAMLHRWEVYLERTRRSRHPVFVPWHALAALPEADFEARASVVCARLGESPHPVNPIIARALADHPPKTLAEAARTYARVLNGAEALWQESAGRAALNGSAPPPLPVAALEELRRVFHGPDSAPDVPPSPVGDLALLPDRPSQAELQKRLKAVETWRVSGPGAPPRAMALEDAPTPASPRVFLRGNPSNLGEAVPRRFLKILSSRDRPPFRDGSGRLELARAIVDRGNPLTARVLVNRVWMHHFGTPLVGTPGDFGLRSEPPTHPELLDHLASTFRDGGWSIKALHRRIMLSSTYQQASDDRAEGHRVDPENVLLWRMNRRRLDFEALRDALLAASGRLDRTIGGPSIKEIAAPSSTRRTLYGFIDRLNLPGLYRTFDFPDPNATSPRRDQTTVAPQALFLMNHPFVIEAARALLKRPEIARETEVGVRIERVYHRLLGRKPDADEVALARGFVERSCTATGQWEQYCQALLLSNEFAFVD
jgi:mono/diheme cytochrome c family protein